MFRLKPHSNTSPCSSSSLQANMFSKLSVVAVSVLVTLAAAIPNTTPPVTTPTSNQCCASVQSSSSNVVSALAALLGLDLSGLNVPIGLSCSPITVLGNNCGGTEVTCDAPEKEWGGLIAINCIPITL
ncbi:Hydrophobin 2 [Mycena sanguinolenta]|uniref:Hydrophobin n=1 Tax=Mycena sanguinolenta TaxID=230812 RepID=A0A8H6WQY0_9AGAR|nr:Hydrophobin 2 [Mycena sanguinolenta]